MRNFKNYKKLAATAIFATACLSFDGSKAQASILPIITSNPNNTFIQMIGKWFDAFLNTKNTQAVVDAQDKSIHDKTQLEIAEKYTIDTDGSGQSSYRGCYTALTMGAANEMRSGISGLSGGMAPPNQKVGVTPAQHLSSACAGGFIDTAQHPGLKAVVQNCTPVKGMADTDINFASIIKDIAMTLPATVTADPYGVLTVPTLGSVGGDIHQQNFIAAYTYCLNKIPDEPASSDASSGNTGPGVLNVNAQRIHQLDASASFNTCTNMIARNTAIPPGTASKLGGNFKIFSDSAQTLCTALTAENITDLPDTNEQQALTNCSTNGISLAMAEQIQNDRYSSNNFQAFLLSKQLTPEDVTMATEHHRDIELVVNALHDLKVTNEAVALNTMPNRPVQGPSALDKQISEQHEDIMKLSAMVKELIAVNQTLAENAASKKTTDKHLTALDRQFAVTTPLQTRLQTQ